jgi:hypothetical protein
VQSIGLTKSAIQQFLYQYNIAFIALSETSPFDTISKTTLTTQASNVTVNPNGLKVYRYGVGATVYHMLNIKA